MPRIRATRPINPEAAKAANDDFYQKHPDMVINGKRRRIDSCDPNQARLRQEWMNGYQRNGGKVERVGSKHIAVCEEKARRDFPPRVVSCATTHCPLEKETKPKPNPKPVREPPRSDDPCQLTAVDIHCSHKGRKPGPEGILMVVPDSTASIGDQISATMRVKSQCGQHPSWTVGGYWDSTGKGASFDFLAKTWEPSVWGLLELKSVSPHVYRIETSACAGGPQAWEVRAYPPGGFSDKIDLKAITKKILEVLEVLPIPHEEEKKNFEFKILQGMIQYSSGWKEDEQSWKAYYEMVISGGFDPLLGIAYKRQIYPPNLAPKFITKYFKAGFFIELTAGIPLSVSFKGKHWPDTGKSEWKEVEVKGSGKIGIALSLELKLAKAKNAELVEGAIVGESGMEFEFSGVMREPEVKFQAKFPGIKGKATIKIWSGWVELNREFQLVAEHPFEPHIWKLGE